MLLSWLSILVLFIVLNLYLILGMVTFHYLETEKEDTVRNDTEVYKSEILSKFACLDEESLDSLIRVIANAIEHGIDPSNSSTPSNWDWYQTFFFSGTIITTIGYGHISPNTKPGQSFSVIYAIIGIPICGILLSALANRSNKFKDKLLTTVYQRLTKKWKRKVFSLFIINGCGSVLFIFIPTAIFHVVEGWSYHNALYFCFITLTTVGFGDFVPGQNRDVSYPTIYKVMCMYWILLGLVYLAIIIQDVSDAFTGEVEKFDEKAASVRDKVKAKHSLVKAHHNTALVHDVTGATPHKEAQVAT